MVLVVVKMWMTCLFQDVAASIQEKRAAAARGVSNLPLLSRMERQKQIAFRLNA